MRCALGRDRHPLVSLTLLVQASYPSALHILLLSITKVFLSCCRYCCDLNLKFPTQAPDLKVCSPGGGIIWEGCEPVGSGAFLEEGSQWGQACEHYNLALSPSPALSPS